jgi:hypothetical protein
MGERVPRGRSNSDGSVDVWIAGRRLHFPGGGRRPTVTDEEPPADAGELPRSVRADVGDTVTIVGYDGWYARIAASGVSVNRARADRRTSRVFRRFGRRA